MAGFIEKMRNVVFGEEYDEDYGVYDDVIEDEYESEPKLVNIKPLLKKKAASEAYTPSAAAVHTGSKVISKFPKVYADADDICEEVKAGNPVIVSLELVDEQTGKSIIDFLVGVSCALDGSIQRLSTLSFIIAPRGVDLDGEFKEAVHTKNGVFDFMASK